MTRSRLVVAGTVAGLIALSAFAYVSLSDVQSAEVLGFQRTGDTHKIVLVIGAGILDEIAERNVQEDTGSVTVRVQLRRSRGRGGVPAILVPLPVTVSLKDQLGTRTVRDGQGKAVKDLGDYQPPAR
jgi:hypothetical protein